MRKYVNKLLIHVFDFIITCVEWLLAPKLVKPPTLELRTLSTSESLQKDAAILTTNASGFELRIDWNGSFYIGGPLNFYVVFVTIQLSPPACLQVNASNSTLIACNGSATVCTLSLSAFVYPQSMQNSVHNSYKVVLNIVISL